MASATEVNDEHVGNLCTAVLQMDFNEIERALDAGMVGRESLVGTNIGRTLLVLIFKLHGSEKKPWEEDCARATERLVGVLTAADAIELLLDFKQHSATEMAMLLLFEKCIDAPEFTEGAAMGVFERAVAFHWDNIARRLADRLDPAVLATTNCLRQAITHRREELQFFIAARLSDEQLSSYPGDPLLYTASAYGQWSFAELLLDRIPEAYFGSAFDKKAEAVLRLDDAPPVWLWRRIVELSPDELFVLEKDAELSSGISAIIHKVVKVYDAGHLSVIMKRMSPFGIDLQCATWKLAHLYARQRASGALRGGEGVDTESFAAEGKAMVELMAVGRVTKGAAVS